MLDLQPIEQAARVQAMRGFALAHGVPEQAAAEVYERELRIVAAIASVQRFVPLIAEKRAKAALRTTHR